MHMSRLIVAILGALLMTFVYTRVESMTGVKVDALLYAAMIMLAIGLYVEHRIKDKETTEEET